MTAYGQDPDGSWFYEVFCEDRPMRVTAPTQASLEALVNKLNAAAIGGEWCLWADVEFEEHVRRLQPKPDRAAAVWVVAGVAILWWAMTRQ